MPEGKLALIDFGLCAEVPLPDTRVLTLAIVHMMQGDMKGAVDSLFDALCTYRGRCYDHNFLLFLPIFGGKNVWK
jgi:hypothetical protein